MSVYTKKCIKVYMTKSIQKRLRSLLFYMERNHYTKAYLRKTLGVDSIWLKDLMEGNRIPELWRYQELANVFEWDLSRDVNYIVYSEVYTKQEIRSRFEYLGYYDTRAISLRLMQYSAAARSLLCSPSTPAYTTKCIILKFLDHLERAAHLKNGLNLEE